MWPHAKITTAEHWYRYSFNLAMAKKTPDNEAIRLELDKINRTIGRSEGAFEKCEMSAQLLRTTANALRKQLSAQPEAPSAIAAKVLSDRVSGLAVECIDVKYALDSREGLQSLKEASAEVSDLIIAMKSHCISMVTASE